MTIQGEKRVFLELEHEEVSEVKRFALGTRLVKGPLPFRYAKAGPGYLKADYPAYARFEGELRRDVEGRIIMGLDQKELFWSDLRPEGEKRLLMGWPVVDVAPGQYFWLREKL